MNDTQAPTTQDPIASTRAAFENGFKIYSKDYVGFILLSFVSTLVAGISLLILGGLVFTNLFRCVDKAAQPDYPEGAGGKIGVKNLFDEMSLIVPTLILLIMWIVTACIPVYLFMYAIPQLSILGHVIGGIIGLGVMFSILHIAINKVSSPVEAYFGAIEDIKSNPQDIGVFIVCLIIINFIINNAIGGTIGFIASLVINPWLWISCYSMFKRVRGS